MRKTACKAQTNVRSGAHRTGQAGAGTGAEVSPAGGPLAALRRSADWLARWFRREDSPVFRTYGLTAAALLSASAASAQQPLATPVYTDSPYVQPGAPTAPTIPGYAQNPANLWPQGTPNSFHPYPRVSPHLQFNQLSEETYNDHGVWMQKIFNRNRRYHFDAEAAFFDFGDAGSAVIGSEPLEGATFGTQIISPIDRANPTDAFSGLDDGNDANPFLVGALPDILEQLPPDFVFVGPGTFPYPFLAEDAQPATSADLSAFVRNDLFPVRTLGILGKGRSVGTRLKWGFDNGDGTGVEFRGFYSGQVDASFERGLDEYQGMPINSTIVYSQLPQFLSIQNGSIPLDNGLPTFPEYGDALKVRGYSQKFDVFYSVSQDTELYGGGLLAFNRTLVDGTGFRVRMFWGADYFYLDEAFSFRGIDSGLSYPDEDFTADGGNLPGGQGGGGGGGNDVFFPQVFGGINAVPLLTPLSPDRFFRAELDSATQSHLAGPTVGLAYDLGRGKNFRILGETTFGLLANHQRTVLTGNNIGEQTASKTVYGIDFLTDPNTGLARPENETAFKDSEDSTHVSPMLKQTINANINVGVIVPPLKDTDLFGDCYLNLGYGFTYLGEIQRPGDAIRWRGFPEFSSVREDRESLFVQDLNIGLRWDY